MTSYNFFPELFVRTPLFSYKEHSQNCSLILEREDFKTALFFASRTFYNELSKKNFVYEELTEKQRLSVAKYINRAAFRSTPFGLFSSITSLSWSDGTNEPIVLEDPHLDLRLDFAILVDLWEQLMSKSPDQNMKFSTNSSVYINSVDIRFIKRAFEGAKTKFSVVSAEKSQVLIALLKFCQSGKRTYAEMLSFLCKDYEPNEAALYISELIEEELIISETSPHLTGKDYWEVLSSYAVTDKLLKQVCDQVNKIGGKPGLAEACHLSRYLDQKLLRPETTNYFYCISERRQIEGSLTKCYQKGLQEGLYCLDRLSPYLLSKDLQAFKLAFTKAYDDKEMPLLEIMDAQFGIGYGGLDKMQVGYGFSSAGYSSLQNKTASGQRESELSAWFLNQWKRPEQSRFELEIGDEHLISLAADLTSNHLAPSISIMFRTVGEMVFIESAGGVSALGLIGRFSFLDDIDQHSKNIARMEESVNKNVVFAEIAHLCDLHTANISRRQHFYEYEIPVLTNSTQPRERQLPLSDLMVSVKNDQVILRSVRLNRVVIPRLSSAFNYSKNDLPVFRFLCDLQTQGIKSGFSFSLSSIAPGLKFYPRLRYKSCILQLAEWHFRSGELPQAISANAVRDFQQLARAINLPRHFSYNIGDHFLVFDLTSGQDLEFFLQETKGKDHVVIKEFPFLSEGGVTNKNGEPLLAQYIATLYREQGSYDDVSTPKQQVPQVQNEGREWIYFKLYCHPLSSDIVLRKHIFPLIERFRKNGWLDQWFWLRYLDPEYHIRIRIKAFGKSKQKLLKAVMVSLNGICSDKLAHYFRPDTYERELERYSPELIERVETVFEASSEALADRLMNQDNPDYEDSMVIVEGASASYVILDAFGLDLAAKALLCKNRFEAFFKEFNSSKELKTEIERLYRSLQDNIVYSLENTAGSVQYDELRKTVKQLYSEYEEKKPVSLTIESLAADLIHMHQNRLFIHEQRYFEMIQYYLLYRTLYRQLYKAPA